MADDNYIRVFYYSGALDSTNLARPCNSRAPRWHHDLRAFAATL